MADLIAQRGALPGCRVLPHIAALTVRHFAGDATARAAVEQVRLEWPQTTGMLTGTDPYLAWRSPQEMIAVASDPARLQPLLERLAAGYSETAFAAELSEALVVIELHGPLLDEWLAHLVDALSIPREPGRAVRARLADAAVMLLRFTPDRAWLLADRPIRPYIEEWLMYSHEGAFSDMRDAPTARVRATTARG